MYLILAMKTDFYFEYKDNIGFKKRFKEFNIYILLGSSIFFIMALAGGNYKLGLFYAFIVLVIFYFMMFPIIRFYITSIESKDGILTIKYTDSNKPKTWTGPLSDFTVNHSKLFRGKRNAIPHLAIYEKGLKVISQYELDD